MRAWVASMSTHLVLAFRGRAETEEPSDTNTTDPSKDGLMAGVLSPGRSDSEDASVPSAGLTSRICRLLT